MTRKDWKHEKSNLHAPCPADDAGSFRRLRQAERNADHRTPLRRPIQQTPAETTDEALLRPRIRLISPLPKSPSP